jgi:hypothetical protein
MTRLPRELLLGRCLLLLALFTIAVGFRMLFLRQVKDLPTYRFIQSDELAAHQAGVACMQGRLPPDAYLKAPLYTYFLAAVYSVFGPDPYYARIVQAVISGLAPVLVFLIAERLFGRAVGVISGLIGAAFWVFVLFAVELVDASLATLFYLLLAWTLVVADDRRWWHWAVAGAVMGVGAITRPNILLFAPVLVVAVFILTLKRARGQRAGGGEIASPTGDKTGAPPNPSGSETPPTDTIVAGCKRPQPVAPDLKPETRSAWRGALINVVALTAGCCAVIAPVTIRNRIVGGEWVLIAAYGGMNLWVGNSPDSDGKNVVYLVGEGVPQAAPIDPNDAWSDALGDRVARYYAEKTMGRRLRRGELDSFFSHLALKFISEHPRKFIVDTIHRTCYLFNAYEFATVRDPYLLCCFSRLLNVLSYFHFGVLCPLLGVGVVAAVMRRPKPPGLIYCLLLMAAVAVGGVLFVVNSRFRMPLVFLGVPLAALGIRRVRELCRTGQPWSRRLGYGAVLLGLALLSNWDFLGYRPAYHTDLRFAEAAACWEARRADLMAQAAPRLEDALQADQTRGCRTWATLITHSRPNTLLFAGYSLLGNLQKVFQYGTLMSFEEPFDPVMARPFFEIVAKVAPDRGRTLLDSLMQARRKEAAGFLLEILSPCLPETEVVDANLQYARQFKDVAALRRAERFLAEQVRRKPDDPSQRALLDEVRSTMRVWTLQTQSATREAGSELRGAPRN